MSLRSLYNPVVPDPNDEIECKISKKARNEWSGPFAAETAPNTISIFDPIGEDIFGNGFTAKRMDAALRAIGQNPVTVKINSPGGDVFEGFTIYNLLRDHKAKVTVQIMGIAASAASFIAMAGDTVTMGDGSCIMIHNCWGVAVGGSDELAKVSETFAQLDEEMAKIYARRVTVDIKSIREMMKEETFIYADDAIALGFADSKMAYASAQRRMNVDPALAAKMEVDRILAEQDKTRSERRKLFREIAGTPSAAGTGTQDAAEFRAADFDRLINTLKSK